MRTAMSKLIVSSALLAITTGLTACDKSGGGISILSTQQDFKVSISAQPKPIDILWVVDNSGSMESSQNNLTANFNAFIQDFVALKYDFRMAVTTSDVWYNQYNSDAFYSPRWRKGNRANLFNPSYNPQGASTDSGVFVMDKNTPSINTVFTTNAKVGTQGNGDERAFDSFVRALNHPANSDFRRSGAYLAIIILSDEEDFSRTDSSFSENYNDAKLRPVSYYVNYLDTYTGATSATRKDKYQVSNISILDSACLSQLNNSAQKINIRYKELATATNGSSNSLCASFSAVLNNIKTSVITAAAVFKLDREPIPESIAVKIDGATVASGPSTWTYEADKNQVRFSDSLATTVSADSNIQITYDPKSLL